MISLRDVPLSGDKLTDWVFKQFIFFIRRETLYIKRKKRLLNPNDKHHCAIRGLMDPEFEPKIEITINSAKSVHANRNEEVETLIHELCHILFWKTQERSIWQTERILIKKFTKEQKDFLKSFIPHHEVKN
ncbi:MAG: hypothetical protein HYT65_01390 [Candidatus Yanofskybacteria bacterium]|nr:hypothetical protein [Candidatus Yanofskybacteria bacterium]